MPRSQEESSEELVGANAILNRNIHRSLQKWQQSLWRLPCCLADRPLTNIYATTAFQTTGKNRNIAAMLLNKHIREKALDTIASEQMNRKFQANKRSTASSASAAVTGVDLQDVKAAEQAAFMAGRVLTALRDAAAGPAAKAATSASAAPGAAGAGAAAADASAAGADDSEETKESSRGDKALKQIGLTFSELINTIAEAKEADHATSNVRGTRFAHATVFAQEAEESSIASVATGTAAIGGAIGGGNSNSSAAAGGAGGGPSALDIYNSTYNTAFSAALAAGLTANTQASIDARNTALANALAQVKGDLTARKQLMEIEEGVRQEQLLATRNAIEEFTLRGKRRAHPPLLRYR